MLRVENVSFEYHSKYQTVKALDNVSCSFEKGKIYSIMGQSGSGKTTLLSLLAGLAKPASGEIFIDGEKLSTINLDEYRTNTVSTIYQSFNLFPLLNIVENVAYPLELQGMKKKEAYSKAKEFILSVGLTQTSFKRFPPMLSGGEQQRIAIARALAANSKILLADEPTGNLDTENGNIIIDMLQKVAYKKNRLVIIVTHDENIGQKADEIILLKDGKRVIN